MDIVYLTHSPQGSLSVINVADFSVRHYDFDDLGATDASLIAKGAILADLLADMQCTVHVWTCCVWSAAV